MKKTTLFLFAGLLFGIHYSNAQEAGLIRGGFGLALGSETALSDTGDPTMGLGITVTGDYFITEKIAIAPRFTYFFKSSVGDPTSFELSINASALDFDGKYYFLTDQAKVYGLFGIAIGFAKASATIDLGFGPETSSSSDSEVGINIGGGVDYYLSDTMFLSGQVKYNTPFEQIGIDLGVGFNF